MSAIKGRCHRGLARSMHEVERHVVAIHAPAPGLAPDWLAKERKNVVQRPIGLIILLDFRQNIFEPHYVFNARMAARAEGCVQQCLGGAPLRLSHLLERNPTPLSGNVVPVAPLLGREGKERRLTQVRAQRV